MTFYEKTIFFVENMEEHGKIINMREKQLRRRFVSVMMIIFILFSGIYGEYKVVSTDSSFSHASEQPVTHTDDTDAQIPLHAASAASDVAAWAFSLPKKQTLLDLTGMTLRADRAVRLENQKDSFMLLSVLRQFSILNCRMAACRIRRTPFFVESRDLVIHFIHNKDGAKGTSV